MIADATEVNQTPQAIRYFAQDMVIYRGESGRVVVIDAYCPHMGAHFAKNTSSYVVLDGEQVQGDSIRCPFHGWKFSPEGNCEEVPYSPVSNPPNACVKSWPVVERAGCVFLWHDPEGEQPDYDVPVLPEWDDANWVQWKIDHLGEIDCHPIELVDNIADKAHLTPIHGSSEAQYFENVFDGHIVIQDFAAGHRTLASEVLTNYTWYTGPGILMSRMGGDYESIIQICHTPVEDGQVRVWHALLVKSADASNPDKGIAYAREYQEVSRLALMQDYEIWANKNPCFQLLKVIGDGPFGQVRRWYKQFYDPREEALKIQEKCNGRIVTKGTVRDPWPEKKS
ncbi:Rieske 2Fe-2S domain-containing protein [Pseudomaricurvus alkylphenolicus]|uniref:Rieske 2Fe-2S domain-containing protein n=1 Tax=Pseudomaricurvus alkylphenolicus TaxID=1306991 RepID=UPI00197FF979|nr:Rieske 2Fe-2S domain-containing protein [Pseudomaricurvus alkylphenolicus]